MTPLTFRDFDERAVPTKTPDGPLLLWAAGLGGENAEVAEAMLDLLALTMATGNAQDLAKKIERDGDGQDVHGRRLDHDAELLKECGDVLFYVNRLLRRRGLTIEDAAKAILDKLGAMREHPR